MDLLESELIVTLESDLAALKFLELAIAEHEKIGLMRSSLEAFKYDWMTKKFPKIDTQADTRIGRAAVIDRLEKRLNHAKESLDVRKGRGST